MKFGVYGEGFKEVLTKMEEKQEKQGLMIGFITDGMVPAKWMMRMNELGSGTPSGIFWKYCWYEGRGYKQHGGYAKARQKVVDQARANNARWLFFVDTDVFPPQDAITRLMAHDKKIVTGIYYMKTHPPQPVIFQKLGDGPYWNFPVEELVEIEGAGLGCTLIDMEVFDEFERQGISFFDENWVHTKPDGSKVKVKVGEDHWFFMKAKELGFQPYCDTSVLCDHMEFANGAIFPGEEEVEKIRQKILKKKNRKDIIDKEKELFGLDHEKKTIVFYNATPAEFSGDELEKRGVGGSEGDIINLAKRFAKHFNVVVFCKCPRPGVYDGVHYVHYEQTEFMKKFKTDLFVSSRNTQLLADLDFKEYFNIDKVCLWTHDLAESYVFDKLPKALPNIDRIFTLTKWHRDNIRARFRDVPESKYFQARNGVDVDLYKGDIERNPYKLIYSSTPFRGLDVLLEVFPQIKKFVPEAELHVFSSMKVYNNKNIEEDKKWEHLYKKAKETDGVVYHGTVTRKELAKHMKSSAVLAYPNHYPETMCITAAEAVVAGTPIVTSNKAALPETIPKGCAILINGDAHTEEYKKEFVNAVVGILQNKALWEEMHNACKGYEIPFSWEVISKEWVKEFFPEELDSYSKKLELLHLIGDGNAPVCVDFANGEDKTVINNHIVDTNEKVKKKKECKPCSINIKEPENKRVKIAKEKGWDEKLVKYREDNNGNLNTQEYWDNQYKYENEKGLDQRTDKDRWDIMSKHIKDGDTILDYGCGLGEFLLYIDKKKPLSPLYGIDISPYALKVAEERLPRIRTTTSIEGLPHDLKKNYFDVISCQHVIEHFDNPEKLISVLSELLTKDGKLILVVPINDDEWIEHQKVWQVQDIVKLLDKFNCTYTIKHRKETIRRKQDGSFVEEAIVIISFD